MIHWQYGAETGVTGHEWEAARAELSSLQYRLDRATGKIGGRWEAALNLWEPHLDDNPEHLGIFAWWRWWRALGGVIYVAAAGVIFIVGIIITALVIRVQP